jgi:exodeoxyribonuclease V alpha subunit
MMAAVLEALPASARLVLLGDKDQLASVEAGAVLGDLCRRADAGHYGAATRDWLADVAGETLDAALLDAEGLPLDQAVVKLRRSHRFGADSGIGRLAEAVNAGDVGAMRRLQAEAPPDLAWLALGPHGDGLARLVLDGGDFPASTGTADGAPVGYRHYLRVLREGQPDAGAAQPAFDAWAREVLAAHAQFQLLCPLRRGPQGVEGLNARIAQLLFAEGLMPAVQGWYLGRPVMVTRNDPGLGLMNGDVGITLALPQPADDGTLQWIARVAFAAGDGRGGIRWVLPSRLQAVETVFAMTVHKSQGSEFTHAALVLPAQPSPVLTRELVYTGVTRARRWFTIAGFGRDAGVLEDAVGRRVMRASGLFA